MGRSYRVAHVELPGTEQDRADRAVSVIVPAFQAASTLRDSIEAIRSTAPPDTEIVVVDDGSFDGTTAIASELADRVVVRPCQGGAARCRNDGARVARGHVLLFVDADVTVEPGAVPGVLRRLDDGVDACFGAYSALPPRRVRNAATTYKNLLHHYVHSRNPGPATTFWSGFGAVRRRAFLAVGGFDPAVTTTADVEDIDLGYRLTQAGFTILLDPTLQVQHHKRYTVRSVISSDISHRAVPWSRAIFKLRAFGATLNVGKAAVVASLAALGATVAFVAAPVVGAGAVALGGVLLAVWLALNAPFLRYVSRRWSLAGACFSAALLFLYSLYAPVGAIGGLGAHMLRRDRTSGLNVLSLDRTDDTRPTVEVTVAVLGADGGDVPALDGLGPVEPWWELLVVGPRPPSNLPPGARHVPCPAGASRFQQGRRALDASEGDFFAVLDAHAVPAPAWLERVRVAAGREDLAVGGSFGHDRRGPGPRAVQVAQFWLWRPEREPAWVNDHPFDNFGFRAGVARALGGFQPALIVRLARFGARPVRFDPAMRVDLAGPVAFWSRARAIGATSRFRAAAVTRYLNLGPLHRVVLVAASPLSGLRELLRIVHSAVTEGSADRTFWLALPLSTIALAGHWVGRDLGLVSPRNEGGLALRTPAELAAVPEEAARR